MKKYVLAVMDKDDSKTFGVVGECDTLDEARKTARRGTGTFAVFALLDEITVARVTVEKVTVTSTPARKREAKP